MNMFFIGAGSCLIIMMIMVFIRVVQGPTVVDRLVGINMIGTKAIVLIVVMGVIFDNIGMFVDIAIGYGLLNFIASIAAAKYFQKNNQLHPEDQWAEDLKK